MADEEKITADDIIADETELDEEQPVEDQPVEEAPEEPDGDTPEEPVDEAVEEDVPEEHETPDDAIAEMMKQVEASDEVYSQFTKEQPAEEPAQPAKEEDPVDEDDLPLSELVARAVRKEFSSLTAQQKAEQQAQQERQRIEAYQQALKQEAEKASSAAIEYAKKHGIDAKTFNEKIRPVADSKYPEHLFWQPKGPRLWGAAMIEEMNKHISTKGGTRSAAGREKLKREVQPAAAGTQPRGEKTLEQINNERADEIVPDDEFAA